MTDQEQKTQPIAKRGLGRGLGALFESETGPEEFSEGRVTDLDINRLEPNREQPRRDFDEAGLNDLATSIRDQGVITPLIVTPSSSVPGHFTIVAGERRWRAARRAGLGRVPVIIRELSRADLQRQALIDNVVRQDLNAMEEAEAFNRLIKEYGMTQENLATALGKSRPAVANTLRLLKLPDRLQALVRQGELSPGHARALLALSDADRQVRAADQVLSRQLSVRETEKLVESLSGLPDRPAVVRPDEARDQVRLHQRRVEGQLRRALAARVTLEGGLDEGRIVIRYHSADERERLIEQLTRSGS